MAVSRIRGLWASTLRVSGWASVGVGGAAWGAAESKEVAGGGQMAGGGRRKRSSAGGKQELSVVVQLGVPKA